MSAKRSRAAKPKDEPELCEKCGGPGYTFYSTSKGPGDEDSYIAPFNCHYCGGTGVGTAATERICKAVTKSLRRSRNPCTDREMLHWWEELRPWILDQAARRLEDDADLHSEEPTHRAKMLQAAELVRKIVEVMY